MILLWGYLQLMRSTICVVVFLAALESYWLAIHRFDLANTASYWAALATMAAYAFANVQNDLLDLQTDRLNYPARPLPAGLLRQGQAYGLAGVLFGLSLVCSWLASWAMFVFTLVMLAVATLYNVWWKKRALWGKCSVALLSAATLLPGYLTVTAGDFPTVPFLVVFCFILARECISTIADLQGDLAGGRRTLLIEWGQRGVLQFCLLLVILSMVLLLWPLVGHSLPSPLLYLLTVLVLAILPVLLAAWVVYRNQTPITIRRVSFNMRYVFFTSLVALLWLV